MVADKFWLVLKINSISLILQCCYSLLRAFVNSARLVTSYMTMIPHIFSNSPSVLAKLSR